MQNKVRIAVIGVGNMGTAHAKNIVEGKIENAELCALCDNDYDVRVRLEKDFDVPVFEDYTDMIKNSDCDTVIIATPHYFHPKIAKDAFELNMNVLTEKPIGVLPSEINKMVEAAEKSGKKFGIMFNQRTNSLFKKAKELVESGALGVKKRLVWIVTNWYRTQWYYDTGAWRASWQGEGGGVLMNQAPHQLDLLQWIFGMPESVFARCTAGKYHNIEVEDDAELFLEYADGATATFITSTGESPGTNRLEISGDKGKIVLEEGKLKFWQLKESEREFCFNKETGFYNPEYVYSEFLSENEPEGHIAVLQNFCNSILFNEPMIASGKEGVFQSKIAQAAYLSWFKNEKCTFPIDEAEYETLLKARFNGEKKNCNKKTNNKSACGEKSEDPSERWQVKW